MEEIWKDVPGYEGYYKISNYGNIIGLERQLIDKRIKKISKMRPNNSKGYLRVELSKERHRKKYAVHRLVAMAFLPNPPDDTYQINHLNGIKNDNRVENLEWTTPRNNTIHAYRNGLIPSRKGESSNYRKLNNKMVLEIRKLGEIGEYSHKEISRLFGISRSHVGVILSRKEWNHI